MRLNQYIAHHSKYSRREADRLIAQGKVSINKEIIKDFSYQVDDKVKVYVNGKCLRKSEEYTVIVYNKPKGELVSKKDDRGRRTIYESLPKRFAHFIPVGRLDFASEGLLLLSDDARVVTKLMESKMERIYLLKLSGKIQEEVFEAMENGLSLQDARAGGHKESKIQSMEFAPFLGYWVLKNSTRYSKIKVAINEGKNRELRRFFAHFGLEILDLKRISYGFVSLNNLPTQKVRFLERGEYNKLHRFMEED
ncbi:pseudouridine synthase [Helicobacter pullorum]|uniref:pseudouridine synthase n=1 Tax=Helicobacter pullorum TaxID=35818 RepID=UPI001DC7D4B3|nr:pseudouridine synthase [Helicobacter pullorum]HJF83332.1 rRNA pseudouridine synthase [Helicobacter pullorum]